MPLTANSSPTRATSECRVPPNPQLFECRSHSAICSAFHQLHTPIQKVQEGNEIVTYYPDIWSLLSILAGVFIMSSMVVFYKKVQESEEGITQAQIAED